MRPTAAPARSVARNTCTTLAGSPAGNHCQPLADLTCVGERDSNPV